MYAASSNLLLLICNPLSLNSLQATKSNLECSWVKLYEVCNSKENGKNSEIRIKRSRFLQITFLFL